MSDTSTFVQEWLEGKSSPAEVDDWVDRWHENGESGTLAEFLGLTSEEYARWVEHPNSLSDILAIHARRAAASIIAAK